MAFTLERTFKCAQQLLLQATLAGLMRNQTLMGDVIGRAVKSGILEIAESADGEKVKTTIRIPLADQGED